MTSIRVGGRWRGRLLERAAFVVAISVAVEARAGGNAAPSVPVLNNPSATTVATTTTPVYSWQPSIDPEGDAITYEVEVRDSSDVVVGARSGITGTVTAFDRELVQYADYTWRARATDSQGAVLRPVEDSDLQTLADEFHQRLVGIRSRSIASNLARSRLSKKDSMSASRM